MHFTKDIGLISVLHKTIITIYTHSIIYDQEQQILLNRMLTTES
jgi:hypothetical protein